MVQHQEGPCVHAQDSVCRKCIYFFLNSSLGENQAQRVIQTFLAWLRFASVNQDYGNNLAQYVKQVPELEYFFLLLVCTHFDPLTCSEWGIDIEL